MKKSVEKTFFPSVFFDHSEKKSAEKNIIFEMAEKSAQIGGYNPPKKVMIPLITPPEKRF